MHKHALDKKAGELDELADMLASGSNRIGALDFQQSATTYVPKASIRSPLSY